MSTLAYVTTGGHYTLNASGFYFGRKVCYSGQTQNYYQVWSTDIGAWGSLGPATGGFTALGVADLEGYRSSGSYYPNYVTGTTASGSISSVSLCSIVANAPAVSGTGSASWSTSSAKYGELYVAAGSSITFKATAASGYKFQKWAEDNNTSATRTITVTDDTALTPIFVPTSYTLQFTTGTGGEDPLVYVDGVLKTLASGRLTGILAGQNIRLVAVPETEYTAAGWTISGTYYVGGDRSFTMPESATPTHTCVSAFTIRDSVDLTLTVEDSSLGNVSLSHVTKTFDLTAPKIGTVTCPSAISAVSVTVGFTGATDSGGSLLKQSELWVKAGDAGTWTDTALRNSSASGSFVYTPSASGRYYFAVVAEDNDGNRSKEAEDAINASCMFTKLTAANLISAANGGVIDSYVQYSTSYPASALIDGSATSYWRSSGSGAQEIVFSFSGGKTCIISGCSFDNNGSSYGLRTYSLAYSLTASGDDWVTFVSGGTLAKTTSAQSITFTPVVAKRVKLIGLSGYYTSTPARMYLYEFTVTGTDYTAPALECSVCRVNENSPALESLPFAIKFAAPVSGFDIGDITLDKTGTADGTLSGFAGSGADYTVNVSGVAGTGTLSISVAASACVDSETGLVSNIASNPAGYAVSSASDRDTKEHSLTVYEGVEYTLTAEVLDSSLNEFTGWKSSDGTILSTEFEYTFTPETSDIEITADFSVNPSYTLVLRATDGTVPWSASNAAIVAGNTLSVDRDADLTDPDRWYEGNVTVTAVPATGWRVAGWSVSNSDAGPGFQYASGVNPLTFNISFNTTVYCTFEKIPVTVSVEVDAPSVAVSAGTAEIAYSIEQQGAELDLLYGDTSTFVATANAGYSFGGWFDADGDPYPDVAGHLDASIQVTANGDVALTAKFKATVTLACGHSVAADDTGTVAIDDGASGATVTADVIIGETCTIEAISTDLVEDPVSGSRFNSWHVTESPQVYTSPLTYLAEQVITVTDNVSLTAYFVGFADLEDRYLKICNYNNNTSEYESTLGILSATAGTEIPATGEGSWALFYYRPPLNPSGFEPDPNAAMDRYYKFTGSVASVITAVANSSLGFMHWELAYLIPVEGEPVYGDPKFTESSYSTIGTTPQISIVTNRHYVLRAVWGNPVAVSVSAKYADGSDSTHGFFTLTPETGDHATVHGGVSEKYIQGASATFTAGVVNGSKFAGWYYDKAGAALASALPSYTHTVAAPIVLYAKFVPDTDAIYKWEGGSTYKMIVWRSKRYTANKPFNPSCARILSGGYPVTLGVYACSSPDLPSPSIPSVMVDAKSQNGFRLPMARPEKDYEIEVSSSNDVTEVAIATSMEGL